jgi:hypothetical protein
MTDASEKRGSGRHLTDIEIAKILGLDRGGLAQRDIALIIGCS